MKRTELLGDVLIIVYLLISSSFAFVFLLGYRLTDFGQTVFFPSILVLIFFTTISIVRSDTRALILGGAFFQLILLVLFLMPPIQYPLLSSSGFIPLAAFVFSAVKHKINGIALTLILLVTLLIGIPNFFIVLFSVIPFGTNTDLYILSSPDGKRKLVATESDSGALGGGVGVNIEQEYVLGLLKTSKLIYRGPWRDRPRSKWLNDRRVEIDDQELDIYSEQILHAKPDNK